jgi:phosphotransferase system HPr (HPr) family protein
MSDSELTAVSRTFVIKNRQGMHLRPASQLVQIFSDYPDAEVTVRAGETAINGKSIMGLLMLEASQGRELTVEVIGLGGEEILARVEETIENRFGED